MIVRTPRLCLRPLRLADLPRFAACRADAELARYQGWSPMDEAEARAFIERMADLPPLAATGEWRQLAIAQARSDELLGDIGLCLRADGEAELGFTLLRDAQGQGYATEAISAMVVALRARDDVTRVVCETDERNAASIRVLERVGMKHVWTGRDEFKGEACTVWRFEMP